MVDPQRRGDGAVPVIPGRFYFSLLDRDPKDTAETHYFRTVPSTLLQKYLR
jgi:hypothetical protein